MDDPWHSRDSADTGSAANLPPLEYGDPSQDLVPVEVRLPFAGRGPSPAGREPGAAANIYMDEMTLDEAEEVLATYRSARGSGAGAGGLDRAKETDMEALMRSLGEEAGISPHTWETWGLTAGEPTYSLVDALGEGESEAASADDGNSDISAAIGILVRMEPTVDSIEESVIELRETLDTVAAAVEATNDRLARIETTLEELCARIAALGGRPSE